MKTLDQCNWKEFRLEDIFTIDPGVRLTTANMTMGKRPFIGATDSNNGITAFVDNTNKSLDSNVLGVNYNGSVVENFYHPYEAIFSDDVKRLHLKEVENNKYICLFIKQSLLKQKAKYQYGYKFNGDEKGLIGKLLAGEFILEEFVSQDGSTKTRTKFERPRSIGEHKEVKEKVKLLSGKYVDYIDYEKSKSTSNVKQNEVVEIDPSNLPF